MLREAERWTAALIECRLRAGAVCLCFLFLAAIALSCAESTSTPTLSACRESGAMWQDWKEGVLDPPRLRDHLARIGRAHARTGADHAPSAAEVVRHAADAATDDELRATIAAIDRYDVESDPVAAAIAELDRLCAEAHPQ
jgi:hypothetical protein